MGRTSTHKRLGQVGLLVAIVTTGLTVLASAPAFATTAKYNV
jgi:hypothetical protein